MRLGLMMMALGCVILGIIFSEIMFIIIGSVLGGVSYLLGIMFFISQKKGGAKK